MKVLLSLVHLWPPRGKDLMDLVHLPPERSPTSVLDYCDGF